MKRLQYIFSLLLLMSIIQHASAITYAYDDPFEFEGEDYVNMGSPVHLEIPADYKSVDFYGCAGLKSVKIPNTVTKVYDWSFSRCPNLEKIEVHKSSPIYKDLQAQYRGLINGRAFTNHDYEAMGNPSECVIAKGYTAIAPGAFDGCTALKSITLPNSLNGILESRTLFSGCDFLSTITISEKSPIYDELMDFNSPAINGKAFTKGDYEAMGKPKHCVIADCYTGIYNGVFQGSSIESVVIPNSVTDIGWLAFGYCKDLKSISIPNSVTTIGVNAFRHCTALESIVIPNSVTKIDYGAFGDCTSLSSITIGDSVTEIGDNAFSSCVSLESIVLPNSIVYIGKRAFWLCSSLRSITIPDSVTEIRDNVFSNCSSLKSITIPDSVTEIGDSAFSSCVSLESITIPKNVKSIGEWSFNNCRSLKTVNILGPIESIKDAAFRDNPSLETILIDENCKGYEDLKWRYSKMLNNTMVFKNSDYIALGSPLHCVIPEDYIAIEAGFFAKTSVESVVIPNSITTIGARAFYNCSSLTYITIPNSVTEIGNHAFFKCKALTSVTIGDSVKRIGYNAFEDCTSLAFVSIPDSVTVIAWAVFDKCDSLESIYVSESSPIYERLKKEYGEKVKPKN